MSSQEILVDIIEFMGVLRKVGKDCVIKEGNITLSVGYDMSDPYKVKENLEKVLATIMEKTPSPFGLPLGDNWVDLNRIVIDTRNGRISTEFEIPPVLFPK